MSKNEKIMHYANFNITFGEKYEPMLEHFEDIIFPAFCSEYRIGKKDEKPQYYFSDVQIKEIGEKLVLVGNFIKDDIYDVYTKIKDGELVSSPEQVPTAPYSRFIIYLNNHRMILVRNESQSPDIRSFQSMTRKVLNRYIRGQNKSELLVKKLPNAVVNIVDIPLSKDIEEVIKDVRRIYYLVLNFFPLNNDIDPFPIAENVENAIKDTGSTRAQLKFTSPKSKENVVSIVEQVSGLAKTTLEVEDAHGNRSKIREDNFRSTKRIPLNKDVSDVDDKKIIKLADEDKILNAISEDNRKIFGKFKESIKKLIK